MTLSLTNASIKLHKHITDKRFKANRYKNIPTVTELANKLANATMTHVTTREAKHIIEYRDNMDVTRTFTYSIYVTEIDVGFRPYLSIQDLLTNGNPLDKVMLTKEYGNIMAYIDSGTLREDLYTSTKTYVFTEKDDIYDIVIGTPVSPNRLYDIPSVNTLINNTVYCNPKQAYQIPNLQRVEIIY